MAPCKDSAPPDELDDGELEVTVTDEGWLSLVLLALPAVTVTTEGWLVDSAVEDPSSVTVDGI